MKRNLFLTLFAVMMIIAGAAFAQQQRNRSGGGTPPSGPQSVLTGTVVSFTAGAGQGMPSLVITQSTGEVTLVLGPYWFLQNSKFTASAGDLVEATVIACADCQGGYAVIAVQNKTNGTSVTLRNSEGLPLWISQRQGRAPGMGRGQGSGPRGGAGNGAQLGDCGGAGPDLSQLATFTGTVKSFTGGAGAGRPTLVLETSEGERTFIVAPYRALVDAGLQLVTGAELSLTAAPNVNGEWVVVTLKDLATGAELVLRDPETGLPINGRHGRH